MSLLEVKNLQTEVGGKKILNGLDLTVNTGERSEERRVGKECRL